MNPNRKMWISAGVVGVVLVGGFSVAAAAASRAGTAGQETGVMVEANPTGTPAQPQPSPSETYIVSEDINPDPRDVGLYWTEDRLEQAEPLPIPVATPHIDDPEPGRH
ncbi:hypothetical protein C1I98_16605 [Spongiactinospora gelatinilytica]|uniref:Secreted protein n=1 Tax=Spongiactinospora gelatinilytica TaxID=2666298 RepID=A0A2W2GXQ8_9ACTN|nr:hypothetical protein [Spongiactinospora gelatinilytica]PZG44735.1 hypothetical protein C1I98_16605 [Spongiactinospora gelatinilytica]